MGAFPMRRSLLSLLLALTLPLVALSAQGPYARLRGVVHDAVTQAPVGGARVVIAATGRFATSDSLGRFELPDLPSGIIRFFFNADGYPRTTVVLAFAKGETMVQRFELEASTVLSPADSVAERERAQRLAQVVITAEPSRGVRYEDFERRLKTGRGQYVTREEIEARNYNTLGDAARVLRGVLVECGGPRGCQIRMARAGQACYPQFIVDGRPDNVFGPMVAIRDVEGLEFYTGASDVPGEFAGANAACGVVVIWTRNGPTTAKPARTPSPAAPH